MAIDLEISRHVDVLSEQLRAPDERWRELTTMGNEALKYGDNARARASYEAAILEAERLVAEARIRGASPAIANLAPTLIVIALQNLAELERREDRLGRATELFMSAFDRIASVAEASDTSLALRAACVRNFMAALAEITEDLTNQGRGEDLQPLFDRANTTRHALARATPTPPTS